MNRQNPKAKQKPMTLKSKKAMHDVLAPAQQLVIPSRHIIPVTSVKSENDKEPMEDVATSSAPKVAEPSPSEPEHTSYNAPTNKPVNVAPVTSLDSSKTEDKEKESTPGPEAGLSQNKAPVDPPETSASVAADSEKSEAKGAPAPTGTDDEEPSPRTRKVVEEAAKADQRQRDLEKMISSRQFFLPVNTVAQKRSIKVSFGLTLLVLLLGIALIDLLLDTGAILLVQRIPHTHFFTTTTNL